MDTMLNDTADHVIFHRRRYGGRHTYTWAFLVLGEERIELGDPWPGMRWPLAVLRQEIAWAKGGRVCPNNPTGVIVYDKA
jgi:hypothetical protein